MRGECRGSEPRWRRLARAVLPILQIVSEERRYGLLSLPPAVQRQAPNLTNPVVFCWRRMRAGEGRLCVAVPIQEARLPLWAVQLEDQHGGGLKSKVYGLPRLQFAQGAGVSKLHGAPPSVRLPIRHNICSSAAAVLSSI